MSPGPVDVGFRKPDRQVGHDRVRAQAAIEAQDRDSLAGQFLLRRAAEDVIVGIPDRAACSEQAGDAERCGDPGDARRHVAIP
jgi:hypothetical protein